MDQYADIIIDINARSLDRIFQYRIPPALEGKVKVGSKVILPFGRSDRTITGIVVDLASEPSFDRDKIKDILSVSGDIPVSSARMIRLAGWMKEHFGGNMTQALKTVMPVKKPVKEVKAVRYVISDRDLAFFTYNKIKDSKREKARARMLEAMLASEDGSIDRETACGVLRISLSTINSLIKSKIIREESSLIYRNPAKRILSKWGRVTLTEEQQGVVDEILSCPDKERVHLIHGITGSGKTEVYMALMDKVLEEGKQVIVLIPEISLTLQTVSRFYDRFGSNIAIMNSRLSAGEKYDQYMRAQRGDASIMIGPRSALFTPFDRLGLIIIDEEHEAAYKSETVPKYHARDLAIERAGMEGAMVVLGSATPSLSSYYNCCCGKYSLHTLKNRAKAGAQLAKVEVADLREEFKKKNMSILSGALKEAMQDCLSKGEQMMLFINRRGYAGFVSCRSCGYVFKCRHCDVSMTIHNKNVLRCHYCGASSYLPKTCPSCGSPYIASFGLGTEKVEEIVQREFPGARILRMDKDTTGGKDDMARILQEFSEGSADILIGTQMIVKGHDFENVTLVGVIAADLSMFSGDYLSSERTFQLLVQAAGRAGRADKPGRVIIQTYRPDDNCVKYAALQDFPSFYEKEMSFRRSLRYPPAAHMLMITAESENDKAAAGACALIKNIVENAASPIRDRGLYVGILGPSRAGISKIKDFYRYVIYVKCDEEDDILHIKNAAFDYIGGHEQEFRKVFTGFDIDPYTLY